MTKLLNELKKFFKTPAMQSDLDAYIKSKCPTSPAEVDHWIRQYDLSRTSNTYNWGRGL